MTVIRKRGATPGSRRAAPLLKHALLPLSREIVDSLSLQHHLTLQMFARNQAGHVDFSNIGQIVYLTQFLVQEGVGAPDAALFGRAHDAMGACALRCARTGQYHANDEEFDIFAQVLSLHDYQLQHCPAYLLHRANERLRALFARQKARAVHDA